MRSLLSVDAWRQGNVRTWYLKPKQATALAQLCVLDDPFLEASRRYGKTTTVLAHVVEESNQRKGIISRWCEPWKNQCREIVMTEMDQIQSGIPKKYQFKWSGTDSFYYSPITGSRIYLRGVNEDRGESARGSKAHIVVADELGSWREPVYVLNEVLRPQLLTTHGKLIVTGTPPRNLTHPYYKLKEHAQAAGRFIQRLITDQELVPWNAVEKLVTAMGGWESPAVKRELLCEKVVDPTLSIVREWDDKYIQAVEPDQYYPFYLKYDAVDTGVRDNTVCLIAYYDFMAARLVVLDEVVLSGPEMTTEKLAELTREHEALYFRVRWEEYEDRGRKRWRQHSPPHLHIRRVSDIDLRLVNDLSTLHGLYFEPTDKGYLEEMVNEMRIWVGSGRVIVHPRCKNLIDCLRYGIWNEDRTKWDRPEPQSWEDMIGHSEFLGHFDALAALMYMLRNVDTRTNPIPLDFGKPSDEYFFAEEQVKKRERFKKMFNVK